MSPLQSPEGHILKGAGRATGIGHVVIYRRAGAKGNMFEMKEKFGTKIEIKSDILRQR